MTAALLHRFILPTLSCWLAAATAWAQAPANDDPCGAISLTFNGNACASPTVGSNANATTTVVTGHQNPTTNCGAGGTQPHDVWYSFSTANTGPSSFGAAITVTGNPAGQLRLYAAPNGCTGPFTLLACSAASASNSPALPLVTGALQPITRYYVCVNGYADTDLTGAFSICVTYGLNMPTCGSPLFTGSNSATATSATVAFTSGANSGGPYQAVLMGGGATQTITTTASPLQFTGLTAATTYQLRWSSYAGQFRA